MPKVSSGDLETSSSLAKTISVQRFSLTDAWQERDDAVAVEEPMEIRVGYHDGKQRRHRNIAITMRTPGHDFDLAVGFLWTEGLITNRSDIQDVQFCGPPASGSKTSNIVRVELGDDIRPDLKSLERNFFMNSSCGLCGKASLDALSQHDFATPELSQPKIHLQTLMHLAEHLRDGQQAFASTGGLHGAGLFSADARAVVLREDVGRHNAVDKLVGSCLLEGKDLSVGAVLVLSGRISFELLQKALMAGWPIIVAIGAPSSLAVELGERFGLTLVGFVREGRCNVYSGKQRLVD
jgi:FdhD protein